MLNVGDFWANFTYYPHLRRAERDDSEILEKFLKKCCCIMSLQIRGSICDQSWFMGECIRPFESSSVPCHLILIDPDVRGSGVDVAPISSIQEGGRASLPVPPSKTRIFRGMGCMSGLYYSKTPIISLNSFMNQLWAQNRSSNIKRHNVLVSHVTQF